MVRNREIDGGEEVIEYMVGPRGKIEVGEAGVAGLVREVYGRTDPEENDDGPAPGQNEEADGFEKRLERSLIANRREKQRPGPDQSGDHETGRADTQGTTGRKNNRRRRPQDDDDSDD